MSVRNKCSNIGNTWNYYYVYASEESYQSLLTAIHRNGTLKEIDFNPRVASSIIHRLQGDVTRYCLRKGPESVPQQEQDEYF